MQVIESARPLSGSGEWRWVGESPNLVIGEPPASAVEQFTRIVALFSLPDGRIIVANASSPPDLRIFGPTGSHMGSIGREGQGPLEFSLISGVWFAPPDSLIVYDPRLATVSFLTLGGTLLRRVPMNPSHTAIGLPRDVLNGRFSDGTFLARPGGLFVRGPESGRSFLAAVRVRVDGAVVDTIGTFPDLDYITLPPRFVTTPLFAKLSASLVHGLSYYTGIGDDFTIDHYDGSGRHLRRLRRPHSPRKITKAMLERAVAEQTLRFPDMPPDRVRRMVSSRFRPGTLPAYGREWLIDLDTNLWVPDYTVPGDGRTAWSVFDSGGRWLGLVALPANLRPREIGADYVLGVWRNHDDVETVRRYALRKPFS